MTSWTWTIPPYGELDLIVSLVLWRGRRGCNSFDISKISSLAWESWCETKGVDFLDREVANSCHPSEVGRCVQIGLLCVQHQPVDRPSTLELLSMLTKKSDLPSPKQPIFVVHARYGESTSKDLIGINEMPQSVIQGR
ncbi:unnamed protein product [Brassica oleracea var. botrytis]|uniref:BnaCnng04200D protein n=3 Tax=Brassica TaxID=3705 RepID=A0A078FQA1_BRANA|nr:hypothetical protein HID58_060169 [Brassica napus]CAF1837971.1 unnamed protein product [Brassica napus]CDY15017.1 BnaCnng04200D [Brassica napus]VDD08814.1 unnamed protein product [Brassica oleracea]